uniref:Uncharacterized protein n=1 Tax=Arundo donax TaxID=35708 RepID=A0A0A9AA14_ARUDO
MASVLGLYSGGGQKRRVHARSGRAWRSAAPVRRLLRRLTGSLRSSARPRRAAVRFGYDLHSYSQNFDDGHHRL